LGKVPFFASLTGAELTQVNALFHEEGYAQGEPVYFSGDPSKQLYVVARGKVKLSRHTLSGQDVILDILARGDFFGTLSILGDEQYQETAQAQTQLCVLGIEAQAFQSLLLRYPVVAVAVLQTTAQRLQAAHETIRQLSAFPVKQRIAFLLLKLAEKLGEPGAQGLLIQLPLSRQELAEMAGTTLETASRILSHFQKRGLIQSGRGWIAIADAPQLAAAAREG
jgi:CRP-like cAMP-binding protein